MPSVEAARANDDASTSSESKGKGDSDLSQSGYVFVESSDACETAPVAAEQEPAPVAEQPQPMPQVW